ncbi:unnamed protein product, partial [Mesorhabditis belari]|uniref:Uncharacterized protein n=1 Tax=Mesorhabditis belari TaxID=2138241 RepID=A0AAF3J6E1_9BILA
MKRENSRPGHQKARQPPTQNRKFLRKNHYSCLQLFDRIVFKMRVGLVVRTLQLIVGVTLLCALYNVDRLHLNNVDLEPPSKQLLVRFNDGARVANETAQFTVMQVGPVYAIELSPLDIIGFGKEELFSRTQPVLAASIIEFLDVLLVALVAVYNELSDGKAKKWMHVGICILRAILQVCAFSSILTHRLTWNSLWSTTNVSPVYPSNWIWMMVWFALLAVLALSELCFYSLYRYSIHLKSPKKEPSQVSVRRYSPVAPFEGEKTVDEPALVDGNFSGYRMIASRPSHISSSST